MNNHQTDPRFSFGKTHLILGITLGLIFILGFGIRLYDLNDPPLDFHSTRQLWSAITARGIYYQGLDEAPSWQRTLAVNAWKEKPMIEPIIFETIVAFTYQLLGHEIIWIPRIYSSIFWMVGGLGLYFLARDMTSVDGGVLGLIFYSFVPFGAIASRSFQPDPLMVMWIILAWWTFYWWYQNRSWKSTVIAGLFAGTAMLVKSVAIFMLFGGMAALVIVEFGIITAIKKRQIWAICFLSVLPVAIYTIYGLISLGMVSQFEGRFFPDLLKDPIHYIRWAGVMISVVGFSGLIIGLLGIFSFRNPSQRAFLFGLWGGYGLYGLFFPYHFITHDYYHLPLIPLVALSLTPIAEKLFHRIVSLKPRLISTCGILGVLIVGVGLQVWDIKEELDGKDYRHEPPYWEEIADIVGLENGVLALTQDYGYRLLYYGWLSVSIWPETGHLAYRELRGGKPFVFDEWFVEETQDMDYFLVTRIKELNRQSELKKTLYDHYVITNQGDGFILFDLKNPLP